jgi:hypothetical protein
MVSCLMGLEFAARLDRAAHRLQRVNRRRCIAFGVHALIAISGVSALAFGLVASRTPNAALVAPLAVAGVLAEVREVKLVNGVGVNASAAIALVALFAWGPLPAFCLLLVSLVGGSIAVGALIEGAPLRARIDAIRRDAWRAGNLANLGSAAWAMLAGGAILAVVASPPGASGALDGAVFVGFALLAGFAVNATQFLLGPLIHWTLWYGRAPAETLDVAKAATLVQSAMVLLGLATTVLVGYAGALALALLAPVVLLPLFIPDPARARPASELTVLAATRLYADALAAVVELPRALRRGIPNVLRLLEELRTSGLLAEVEGSRVLDASTLKRVTRRDDCVHAAWTVDEHWDGSGPTCLAGESIPELARILAVAEEWARRTAAGSPQLSHAAAFAEMQPLSGHRFDPAMLAFAQRVVEREQRVTPQAACQPRLHSRRERLRLYLPYAVTPAAPS